MPNTIKNEQSLPENLRNAIVVRTFHTLGVDFTYRVPGVAECYDALSRPGQCVLRAVDNDMFRGVHASVRADAVSAVETQTGVARGKGTKEVTNKKGEKKAVEVYTESEETYITRVLASGKMDKATFAALVQSIADKTELDLVSTGRSAAPKVDKTILSTITSRVAAGIPLTTLIAKFNANTGSNVPAEANAEQLALAMQTHLANQSAGLVG